MFNLFEGLVKPNSKGELIPAVAERYQLSEDGRTYTFTLREGVKFHNGATVTAEDVVYSIDAAPIHRRVRLWCRRFLLFRRSRPLTKGP